MTDNKEEKDFRPASFNWEKPIYRNFHKTIENTDSLIMRFLHIL